MSPLVPRPSSIRLIENLNLLFQRKDKFVIFISNIVQVMRLKWFCGLVTTTLHTSSEFHFSPRKTFKSQFEGRIVVILNDDLDTTGRWPYHYIKH